jgi:antitoxin HigA-1
MRTKLRLSIFTRDQENTVRRTDKGKENVARSQKLTPIHPGEVLRADFMEPLRLSMNRLALDLRVPVTRIAEIVHERRGITPDTALRLARYFNTSAGFWMNLQTSYDLEVAEDELGRTIQREIRPVAMAAANSPS